VLARYPRGHSYWKYLDGLVASLISKKCDGIQDKMKDVGKNNMLKFESTISELRVALLLARSGKSVRLLSDDYLPGKSPDIHAIDSLGNYYVEVVRFSDDETIETIFEQVGAILSSLPSPYRIDVSLSAVLSSPAVDHQERRAKTAKIENIMSSLKLALGSGILPVLPASIHIEGVEFSISRSPIEVGFVGTINSGPVVLPRGGFSSRIRYLVADPRFGKAWKRETWKGKHLSYYYLIAIDVDQSFFEDESALEALLGQRAGYTFEAPKTPVNPKVNKAASKNWTNYLERVHLLPRGRTIFTSYGIYLTDPICENVSGVLLAMKSERTLFIPNPFAQDSINNSKLVDFI